MNPQGMEMIGLIWSKQQQQLLSEEIMSRAKV